MNFIPEYFQEASWQEVINRLKFRKINWLKLWLSNCGPRTNGGPLYSLGSPRRFVGGFRRKRLTKIVSDT
jgi:hypothetical protein